jgi:signal transduction histidine kinase
MLEIIEKDIAYSNKIINDLLDYSREIKLELTEINAHELIKESLYLVEIPKKVRLKNLTTDEPQMKVDADKLKRSFVNIIKNALEAMPKGGTLTITSRKCKGNLAIAFTDTGTGMSKETMQEIFTPLFTSKAKGMGFGLAISKRIVEAHGGKILVESSPRVGSTFTVVIPIRRKELGGDRIWVGAPESLLSTTTKE